LQIRGNSLENRLIHLEIKEKPIEMIAAHKVRLPAELRVSGFVFRVTNSVGPNPKLETLNSKLL
jgi:hypothetical protein